LQKRLLHHPGKVELPLEARIQFKSREQVEVVAVLLQGLVQGLPFSVHTPPNTQGVNRAAGVRPWECFANVALRGASSGWIVRGSTTCFSLQVAHDILAPPRPT